MTVMTVFLVMAVMRVTAVFPCSDGPWQCYCSVPSDGSDGSDYSVLRDGSDESDWSVPSDYFT